MCLTQGAILTILAFSILLFLFSILAGLLGALTGLGGGVVIIPVLVMLFNINIHYAMGASLFSVIATSSGATVAYLRDGYTNLRIGMFLETAAVIGAFVGALLITWVSKTFLMTLFSLVLFFSAYLTIKRHEDKEVHDQSHPWAEKFKLNGDYKENDLTRPYQVQHVPVALFIMGIAGLISGLLGIGSGTLKVLSLDQAMRLPYKVATTTSNFMIGITAAVSVGLYYAHGYIIPTIVFPVMLGVLVGSFIGAKILTTIHTRFLRILFSLVICFIGLQMLHQAIIGAI